MAVSNPVSLAAWQSGTGHAPMLRCDILLGSCMLSALQCCIALLQTEMPRPPRSGGCRGLATRVRLPANLMLPRARGHWPHPVHIYIVACNHNCRNAMQTAEIMADRCLQ